MVVPAVRIAVRAGGLWSFPRRKTDESDLHVPRGCCMVALTSRAAPGCYALAAPGTGAAISGFVQTDQRLGIGDLTCWIMANRPTYVSHLDHLVKVAFRGSGAEVPGEIEVNPLVAEPRRCQYVTQRDDLSASTGLSQVSAHLAPLQSVPAGLRDSPRSEAIPRMSTA
jgi:hypothetical protein